MSFPVLLTALRSMLHNLHQPRATPNDARRLAAAGIFFDMTRPPVSHLKILIHATELQRERIQRSIGTGCKNHRMLGRHTVEFIARWIALLAQPCDEDLTYLNPLAFLQEGCPTLNVVEHILNGFHFRNGMIELNHAGIGGMDVRVDETRKDRLAAKVH